MKHARYAYHALARRYWQTIVVNQALAGHVDDEASVRFIRHLSAERDLGARIADNTVALAVLSDLATRVVIVGAASAFLALLVTGTM